MAWDEKGCSRIHFSVSKVPTSQDRASTSNRTIVVFSHLGREVGSNLYGFYNKFSYDNKATWSNHGWDGQAIKGGSF